MGITWRGITIARRREAKDAKKDRREKIDKASTEISKALFNEIQKRKKQT